MRTVSSFRGFLAGFLLIASPAKKLVGVGLLTGDQKLLSWFVSGHRLQPCREFSSQHGLAPMRRNYGRILGAEDHFIAPTARLEGVR
jgi:hypothetical protein